MKKKKDEGYVEYIFCLFAIFMACICVVIGIRLKAYNMAKENIENEITDSTLASAIVDMKRFQVTGLITNYNVNNLYNKYITCLQKNLNLKNPIKTNGITTKFTGPDESLALSNSTDAINITDYYIYNAELDKKEYYVTKLIENGEVNANPQPELIASGVAISKVYITMKDNSKKKVFMCDNALSIYAKVNFKIKPFKLTVWKNDYSTKEELGTLEYLVDSIGKGERHNYESEIFKEANCTGDGIIKYKCKDCGYVYYEGIPKLGHSMHTEKEEPTCTKEGYVKDTCLRCGYEKIEKIQMLAHIYEHLIENSTCIKEGREYDKCVNCGKIINITTIEKIEHDFKFISSRPIEDGDEETYICNSCGYIEKRIKWAVTSQTSFDWKKDLSYSIGNINTTPNSIYMNGNSRNAGKNCSYAYPDKIGTIYDFTYSYNISFGDSFDCAGMMFDLKETDNNILECYLLSFNNYGPRSVSGANAAIWKIRWQKGNNYNAINWSTTETNAIDTAILIQPLNISTSGTLNVSVRHDKVTIEGGGLSKTTVNLDPSWGGEGFGFFSSHYSHYCDSIGSFNLNNISMDITKIN